MQNITNPHEHFSSVLSMLALHSPYFTEHIHLQVETLFHRIIGPSCMEADINNLVSTMDKHRAIISGSAVLSMIYDNFSPNNID